MKRIQAAILALLLALTVLCAGAETVPEQTEAEAEEPTSLVVGNPTPMRGDFFSDMWGNATSDIDVRDLLHGYNLIRWDGENGMFAVDPSVVSGVVKTQNDEGDHTYILVLYDDLFYSDGTLITAWDYAFSYFLSIAPQMAEIGATPLRKAQIVGYQTYMDSNGTEPLAGIRVLAEDMISITLDHAYLPFFYEMGLLACNPYPISVIAPGVEVRDDGQGIYLANSDPTVTEPVFTAELLKQTILDPETGYRSHPAVVSGPYTLTSWDGEKAEFEINPFYKGNAEGQKPSIDHLTYMAAVNDTMMDQLAAGEFGLLNKVTRVDQINRGMALVEEAGFTMANYPRIGLSYISFACEKPAMADPAVRQAIAYCFDRNAVVTDYAGAFGLRVDGYYGIGQWMYGVISGTTAPPVSMPEDENDAAAVAEYEAKLAEFEALNLDGLNAYEVNTDEAAGLLDKAGWKLNEEGLREKDGTVLDLHLIYPEGNNIETSLRKYLAANLETVGIRLTMEAVPMRELLTRWYRQGERSDDMIYLASNFDIIFDPATHFDPEGAWSYTNLADEELYQAAVEMRQTEPGDVLTYMQRWVKFQERFNTVLPMIPVYSNVYFDFYRNDLQEYDIAGSATWGQAIVGARIGEVETVTVEDAAEGTETFE